MKLFTRRAYMAVPLVLGFVAAVAGCGGNGPIVVAGRVTCGGQSVDQGDVTFVPLDGTPGPGGGAQIVDGYYQVGGRGGLLPGKYRAIVNAYVNTGRKIQASNGFEVAEVDQTRRVGPRVYATSASPLVCSIERKTGGRVDLELPGE